MLINAMCSIVKPLSISKPNKAVPNAVANTINAVVKALIEPICFTPYISAQVDEPRTFAKPLDTPIKPKKINEEIGLLKNSKIIIANKSGKFIKRN